MNEPNILQNNNFIMEEKTLTRINARSGNSEQTFYQEESIFYGYLRICAN